MKNLGAIQDPKSVVTKEYVDGQLAGYRTAAAQDAIDEAQDAAIAEIYESISESGSIVTFYALKELPIYKLTVTIESLQEGSGDPTPVNVRPLSGWTAATVSQSGQDTDSHVDIIYQFPSAAGTVYGGTLTINDDGSGTLVVDRQIYIFTGDETIGISQSWSGNPFIAESGFYGASSMELFKFMQTDGNPGPTIPKSDFNPKCNLLKPVFPDFHSLGPYSSGITQVGLGNMYSDIIFKDPIFGDTVESCAAKLKELANAGTPLTYEGPLREEYITRYQLTQQQVIETLHGQNNIWADCGDVTVEYEYGQLSTIKEELVALRACIAPTEDGATASQAYAAGAYFFRGGNFCKALVQIASGAAFTIGTNYQVTTVAEELIALQS